MDNAEFYIAKEGENIDDLIEKYRFILTKCCICGEEAEGLGIFSPHERNPRIWIGKIILYGVCDLHAPKEGYEEAAMNQIEKIFMVC